MPMMGLMTADIFLVDNSSPVDTAASRWTPRLPDDTADYPAAIRPAVLGRRLAGAR